MIVDDEEDICDLLSEFLEDKGYQTFRATNGDEALQLVKEARPHILLLDIRLPGMSGIEILRNVRSVDPGVGVIMITAFHDMQIAQEALKLGASDFVTKPIDMPYLETSVKTKIKAMLA